MTGISAWNPPNHNPTLSACLGRTVLTDKPLHIDTAKASIETPIAIIISSIRFILIFTDSKVHIKDSHIKSPFPVLNDNDFLTIEILYLFWLIKVSM